MVGCARGRTLGYDRERALFPEDLFAWLEETQQAPYQKALKAAGSGEAKFLDVFIGRPRQAVGAWRRDAEHSAQRGAVHRRRPAEDGAVPTRDDPERDHERGIRGNAGPGDAPGALLDHQPAGAST